MSSPFNHQDIRDISDLLRTVGRYAARKGPAWRIGEGAEIMDAYEALQSHNVVGGTYLVHVKD